MERARLEGADFSHANVKEAVLPRGETARSIADRTGKPLHELEEMPLPSRACEACRFDASLPMTCKDAKWAPSGCSKWLESEAALSGFLGRLAREWKYIKSVPDEEFEGFLKESAGHLLMLRWMPALEKIRSKEQCLALYEKTLSVFLSAS